MLLAVIGLGAIFLFGFYAGHARQSKWPFAELVAACIIAFLLIVLALLYKQHAQGACLQPSYYASYGSAGVCVHIFTLKNTGIGYIAFSAGLLVGLIYRLIGIVYGSRHHAKAKHS